MHWVLKLGIGMNEIIFWKKIILVNKLVLHHFKYNTVLYLG